MMTTMPPEGLFQEGMIVPVVGKPSETLSGFLSSLLPLCQQISLLFFLFSPLFPVLFLYSGVKDGVLLSVFGFLCFASILGCFTSCLTLHVVVVRREMCSQPDSELKWFDGAVKGASRFETLNLGPLCYQREHTWTSAHVRPQLCCLESCLQSFWIVFFPSSWIRFQLSPSVEDGERAGQGRTLAGGQLLKP